MDKEKAMYYGFLLGSNFGYEYGKNEERERAANLLKALKDIEMSPRILNKYNLIEAIQYQAREALKEYEESNG